MITDEELKTCQQPILITIDAQEIGQLYASKTNPFEFIQYLLAKLKVRAPNLVEGVLTLKLTQGRLLKVKDSIQGRHYSDYLWLHPTWLARLNEMGGLASMDTPEGIQV